MEEEKLREICRKFGTLILFNLMKGHGGASQGKAIVGYSTKDEAAEAMKKLYFENELGDLI